MPRFDGESRRFRLGKTSNHIHPSVTGLSVAAPPRCSYELQFIGPAASCHLWHEFHTQFAVDSGPLISQRRPASFTRSVGLLLCHASAACRYGSVPRHPRSARFSAGNLCVFAVISLSFDSARRQTRFTRSVVGLRLPPRHGSNELHFIGSAALRRLWRGFYTQIAVNFGPLISQRRPATFTRSVGLLLSHARVPCARARCRNGIAAPQVAGSASLTPSVTSCCCCFVSLLYYGVSACVCYARVLLWVCVCVCVCVLICIVLCVACC